LFGSLLHDFHNPKYSDIDLIIYGRIALEQLRETLQDFYKSPESDLENEFPTYYNPRNWRFTKFTLDELKQANAAKYIYGLYKSKILGRKVKVEFEPVRCWDEIKTENEYDYQITDIGWTRLEAKIVDSEDSGFMPSIYNISPLKFHNQPLDPPPERIVSYVEEFRLQADNGDTVIVEGPIEQITTDEEVKTQIMLSYNSQYFAQVLKKI
jgi:predicted nucleotidyltransferase